MTLTELVAQHHAQLNENDHLIWTYISNHKKECEKISIEELAHACHVSRTTITRFTKKLSLQGFSELKTMIHWENMQTIEQYDNLETLYERYHQIIDDIQDLDCTTLCERIYHARRLYVFGTGAMQMAIAHSLQLMFLNTHLNFYVIEDYDELEQVLSMISEEDLIVIISISGASVKLKRMLVQLQMSHPYLVSFTKQKENPLAQLSDEAFYVPMMTLDFKYLEKGYEIMGWGFTLIIELLLVKYQYYLEKKERDSANE